MPRPSALYEGLGLERARIRRVGVRMEHLVDADKAYRQPQLTDPERGWREADLAADAAVRQVWAGRGPARRADPPLLVPFRRRFRSTRRELRSGTD